MNKIEAEIVAGNSRFSDKGLSVADLIRLLNTVEDQDAIVSTYYGSQRIVGIDERDAGVLLWNVF